jgi:hypothetical protein
MTPEQIHQAFDEMINKRRIAHRLQMKPNAVKQIRHRLRYHKTNYSLDFKLKLLQRAGYRPTQLKYSDQDIIAILRFALVTTSQAARDRGAEYVFEKFKSTHGANYSVLSRLKADD